MGKNKKKRASSEDSSSDESSDESDSSLTSSSSSSSSSPEKKARKDSTTSKTTKKKEKKKKKKKKSKKKKKKLSKFEIEKISPADYYSRNSEFRAWIRSNDKIEKGFADMETKEAKSLFKKFVKKWNEKKLPKDFYRGSMITTGGGGEKGGFQWGFAGNMDAKTKSEIDAVKKGNEREAGSGKKEKDVVREPSKLEKSLRQLAHGISKSEPDRGEAGVSNGASKVIGPVMPAHIAQARESSEDEDEDEVFERKMQEKRHKDYVKTAEEELCPKATGFEAKLEKKAMARERKQLRDTSPGLSDKVLFGDSSKMGKAIEKRKVDRAVKKEVSSTLAKEKLKLYAEREKAKMEALLEMAKATKKEGALW